MGAEKPSSCPLPVLVLLLLLLFLPPKLSLPITTSGSISSEGFLVRFFAVSCGLDFAIDFFVRYNTPVNPTKPRIEIIIAIITSIGSWTIGRHSSSSFVSAEILVDINVLRSRSSCSSWRNFSTSLLPSSIVIFASRSESTIDFNWASFCEEIFRVWSTRSTCSENSLWSFSSSAFDVHVTLCGTPSRVPACSTLQMSTSTTCTGFKLVPIERDKWGTAQID